MPPFKPCNDQATWPPGIFNLGFDVQRTLCFRLILWRAIHGSTWIIPGMAYNEKEKGYTLKGGTGVGVRLLVQYLRDWVTGERDTKPRVAGEN